VPEDVAARVLDRFTEVGLVDDSAYAEMLVRTRHADRGLARRALAHELHAKGIAPELAERALETLDGDDERRTARELVERKAAGTAGLDRQRRRRRLAQMLARKGYPPGLALGVVDEVLGVVDGALDGALDEGSAEVGGPGPGQEGFGPGPDDD
jgi:regulatory protein